MGFMIMQCGLGFNAAVALNSRFYKAYLFLQLEKK
jgi:hypothetical protein